MPNLRLAAAITATAITTLAVTATICDWATNHLDVLLRYSALGLWLATLTAHYGERILTELTTMRRGLREYGDEQHADGITEGMRRAEPPAPPLRTLNR